MSENTIPQAPEQLTGEQQMPPPPVVENPEVVEQPQPELAKAPEKAKAKPKAGWLDRLKGEAKELSERTKLLDEFLVSPQFGEIDEVQRSLLRSQHTYQTLLLHTLEQRIEAA